MIIRETENHFICIEQDHHAHLAKEVIKQWKDILLKNEPLKEDVLYAVEQHDVGWHAFDKQPLWNDVTNAPYTFIDLPLLIKTILYTKGVDDVEKRNPYAASLCSAHYTKFLQKYDIKEVKQYIDQEQLRRKSILQNFPEVDEVTFNKHLAFLQLADNMSLFLCLHEAGNNDERHRYFEPGIFIPEAIDSNKTQYIKAEWNDDRTLTFSNFAQVPSFSIVIEEKIIEKQAIKSKGLLKAYETGKIIPRKITIQSA